VEKNGSKLAVHTGTEQQVRDGYGSLNVKKGGVPFLATWLSRELGRTVIDKTNLTGEYDYALAYTPDPGQGTGHVSSRPPCFRFRFFPMASHGRGSPKAEPRFRGR
jgi:uncharacterized protein (TIGR03435 family)